MHFLAQLALNGVDGSGAEVSRIPESAAKDFREGDFRYGLISDPTCLGIFAQNRPIERKSSVSQDEFVVPSGILIFLKSSIISRPKRAPSAISKARRNATSI